jgi:hypothetical protein
MIILGPKKGKFLEGERHFHYIHEVQKNGCNISYEKCQFKAHGFAAMLKFQGLGSDQTGMMQINSWFI